MKIRIIEITLVQRVTLQKTFTNSKPNYSSGSGINSVSLMKLFLFFPKEFGNYYEPFLGSGAVLATLAPNQAVASDTFLYLIQIFQTLQSNPDQLYNWYTERWERLQAWDKVAIYEDIKASYNDSPNAADLLFISRSCYGGVVRFRKDGYISTPCGIHDPISPDSFEYRVREWHRRTKNTTFMHLDYKQAMSMAQAGDVIYCDPPYTHSQTILYGAQDFSLEQLFSIIGDCKRRGVHVALSIDGSKKSGNKLCDLPIPDGLFEREIIVNLGRSMLKRFQMEDKTLEGEVVKDRLLLTY